MGRRLRWVLLALVVLLVAGAVVTVVTTRPDMSDARDQVDRAWTPLRPPLVARYEALAGVEGALASNGAAHRSVTVDLASTLRRWQEIARVDDPAHQAPLANDLEALAARVKANVASSALLRGNAAINQALAGFDAKVVNPPAVAAYNQAVRAYQHARTGTLRRLVADVFGFDARPQLVLG
jgi:hypothetical protein